MLMDPYLRQQHAGLQLDVFQPEQELTQDLNLLIPWNLRWIEGANISCSAASPVPTPLDGLVYILSTLCFKWCKRLST